MEANPGAVEAHPGAVEAHPGDVEAHPRLWRLTLKMGKNCKKILMDFVF